MIQALGPVNLPGPGAAVGNGNKHMPFQREANHGHNKTNSNASFVNICILEQNDEYYYSFVVKFVECLKTKLL